MAALFTRMSRLPKRFLSQPDGGCPVIFARYIQAYIGRLTAHLSDLPLDLPALVVQDIAEDDICAFQREEERLVRALSPAPRRL